MQQFIRERVGWLRNLLNTKEELTQQLGEQLPIALRALAKATADAGLIDGSMSQQKQEAAVYKLMQNGKLLSDQVLPQLGKAFKDIANDGNLLRKSLETGLQKPMYNMQNSVDLLTNSFYLGLKPAMRGLFADTARITDGLNGFATVVGRVTGGIIQGFTLVPRLFTAGIADLATFFGVANDNMSEMVKNIENVGERIVGLGLGIAAFIWAIKKLGRALGILKTAGKVIGAARTAAGIATGGSGAGGAVGKLGYGTQLQTIIAELRQIAINTGGAAATDGTDMTGGNSKGRRPRTGGRGSSVWGSRVNTMSGKIVAGLGTGYMIGSGFSQISDFISNALNPSEWMNKKREAFTAAGLIPQQTQPQQNQKVDVNIKVNHPMFEAEVDNRVDVKQQQWVNDAMQSLQH